MIFKTIFLSSSTFFHPLPSITFIFIDIPLILVLTLELLAQPFGKLLFSLLSLFLILSFAGGIFESSHVSSGTTLLVHMLMISGTNFSIAVFSGIPKSMLHLAENMQHVRISFCLFFFFQSRVSSDISSRHLGCLRELVL